MTGGYVERLAAWRTEQEATKRAEREKIEKEVLKKALRDEPKLLEEITGTNELITKAKGKVVEILEDFKDNYPDIAFAPQRRVCTLPFTTLPIKLHSTGKTIVPIRSMYVSLHWGTKFGTTPQEAARISRYQQARPIKQIFLYPLMPSEIVETDYKDLTLEVLPNEIKLITAGASPAESVRQLRTATFLEDPTTIFPVLDTGLKYPDRHRRILHLDHDYMR